MSVEKCLLVIDVQNDFCPGGSLAVKEGDQVIEPLNKMIDHATKLGWLVLFSRDWHQADSTHFADFGGIWPKHCVQNTPGAEFHPKLKVGPESLIISKGFGVKEDSYSAFDGSLENGQMLEEVLRTRRITEIYVGGLATDYCVKASAIDSAVRNFATILLTDAIRAVNLKEDDGDKAIEEVVRHGVKTSTVCEIIQ